VAAAYWVVTVVVVGECAVGGTMDLFRLAPFYPMLLDLRYPGYLSVILGVAKLAAAVVLLVPRLRRLKEWAYAGVMINMLGAAASWLAVRPSVGALVPPLSFAVLALLSWRLRPAARRL
jgi:hypothetical protein